MIKVLMLGPARSVKGGMTSVVDNYYDAKLNEKVKLKYIETCNDSKYKISKLLKEIKGKLEFYKKINNYDVVHIHMASRRSTFRKAKYAHIAKSKGKRVILHIHGGEYKIFYNECNEEKKKYIKETLKLADKIIVLSEKWKEYFEKLVDKEKIVVINNAIKIPDDFEKNLNNNELLFLGRIYDKKGIYDLIDVLAELKKEFKDIHLSIGGDGELEKLKRLIKEKDLEKNVACHGWISGKEKDELLRKSTIFILPSYNEGMPMSVLEAMAYKNIVLTTNVGGIPEVIENNKNGIMIEPGNKKALYNNLKEIFNDISKKQDLSNNARKLVEEKFDINKMINILIKIYRGKNEKI